MARADELYEMTRSGLFQRLKAAVQAAGGNKAVSEASGVSISTLNAYLAGTMMPSLAKLAAIAQACGVTIDFLVSGAVSSHPDTASENGASLIPVRNLAFSASAGNGSLVLDEEAPQTLFAAAVLERLRLRPHNARLLRAVGDSMRPTIEDGDPLLVDLGETEVIDGRIYVFTIGDQVLVKRLRRRGSRLLMRSDNRELYPDEEEVPTIEPVRIIGRVRWVGRSL